MREIKFRTWTGQQMDYNIMAGFLGAFYVQGIDEYDRASMSQFNTKYPENCHVMQFTGLLDKSGNNTCIYEGDIISLQGKLIGNKYETPEILKEETNLLIEGIGTKTWSQTEKEGLDRGLHYAE